MLHFCKMDQRLFFLSSAIFLFSFIGKVNAQDYFWPTDASRVMTSSFGEYRPGHFHSGIDVKTWGQVGFKVFAIHDGSIVRLRVSPYGYGKAVYLRLDNGMMVVYAHLSCFSEQLEPLIKEEQKRWRRFSVDRFFQPGFLKVKKGGLVGYTGDSGNGVPHLHFDVRDTLGRVFNPLELGYSIEDTIPPVLEAVAATPLRFGSHVEGDFYPKLYPLRREHGNVYVLDEIIKSWGEVGLSLSAFDRANGAWNKFDLYRIRLFVDEKPVFSVRYDRFSFSQTSYVDLDRDYRLNQWGWGLFQKLYRDEGNALDFYEPASEGAGILCSRTDRKDGVKAEDLPKISGGKGRVVFLEAGDYPFRIEAADYFGNLSEVRGVLRMVPLSNVLSESKSRPSLQWENLLSKVGTPQIEVERHFFERTVRFCVRSILPLPSHPSLFIKINSKNRTFVPLFLKSAQEFVGTTYWKHRKNGRMIEEVYCTLPSGVEQVIRDTLNIFLITPEKGGTVVSSDRVCRVIFPKNSVYQPIVADFRITTSSQSSSVLERQYDISPQDVSLKESVKIVMDVPAYSGGAEKLGIYTLNKKGKATFVGNGWERGTLFGWTESLNSFTVLLDTVAPEILFIRPGPEMHIQDRMPRIAVGFKDTLSGIFGEENYVVLLDNRRLIVEYVHTKDFGFHQIDEPLALGEHTLDVLIRDRSGNPVQRRSRFYIDPK